MNSSDEEAPHPKTTSPLGRWETPLLFLVGGSTILLWLLQDFGYQAPWFTRIGPWVALGICILSLGLLVVYVLGKLASKKQKHLVATTTPIEQGDISSQLPPEDKTFQQALQDLHKRLTKALSAEIDKRLGKIMGHTIESLITDIDDPALRERTGEALRKVKIIYILSLWRQKGRLNQAEYDELEQFLYRATASGQTAAPRDHIGG